MKIPLKNVLHDRTWVAHAVLHLISGEKDPCKVFNIEPLKSEDDLQEIDIQMTINGVKVDFEQWLKILEKQHDQMLADKAGELFQGRFTAVSNTLERLMRNATELFENEMRTVFPAYRSDDD